jgi:hypothetical protein
MVLNNLDLKSWISRILEKEIQGLDSKNKGYDQPSFTQSGFSWMDQIGFHGWDQIGFHRVGSDWFSSGWIRMFFMDDRMIVKVFRGWIGVFPFFQRSASILSKNQAPTCNLKFELFSIYL